MRNAYIISVEKHEGNRSIGRPRHRWEDNIKMDLKYGMRVSTGFIWLRIWSSSKLMSTQ